MDCAPLQELIPPPPGIPFPSPWSPSVNEGAQISEIEAVVPRYVFVPTPFPNTQFFNLDAYANDHKCEHDFSQDLLTDEGTSTG